jgi:hypothetical protein
MRGMIRLPYLVGGRERRGGGIPVPRGDTPQLSSQEHTLPRNSFHADPLAVATGVLGNTISRHGADSPQAASARAEVATVRAERAIRHLIELGSAPSSEQIARLRRLLAPTMSATTDGSYPEVATFETPQASTLADVPAEDDPDEYEAQIGRIPVMSGELLLIDPALLPDAIREKLTKLPRLVTEANDLNPNIQMLPAGVVVKVPVTMTPPLATMLRIDAGPGFLNISTPEDEEDPQVTGGGWEVVR